MIKHFRGLATWGTILAVSGAFANNVFAETVRIPGAVDGIQTQDKDGVVDAAIVIPSVSAAEIFRFDLESLLGPDEKAKAGPISTQVPGNTYIPKQKEKYGWITVTLEKEEFGFYTEPEKQTELSALWFSAPWDLLLDASKGEANPAALLKSAKFRKLGFAGLKNWSHESKIYLSLDRELKGLGQLKWTRSALPEGQADMVVTFQSTPAGRWSLAGFDGNPKTDVTLTTVDSLPPRIKVVGLRSKFKGQDVISAEGWIVDADRRSKIQFTGVPVPLAGARIEDGKVFWKHPGGEGWMGVVHQPQTTTVAKPPLPSIFDGLFPIANFLPVVQPATSITWVDPTLEESLLPHSYQKRDKVTLILVGTSKAVPAPRDTDGEPELFTFAESLRSVVVK